MIFSMFPRRLRDSYRRKHRLTSRFEMIFYSFETLTCLIVLPIDVILMDNIFKAVVLCLSGDVGHSSSSCTAAVAERLTPYRIPIEKHIK